MATNLAAITSKIKFKKEYFTWMLLALLIFVGALIYVYREPIGKIFPKTQNAAVVDLLNGEEGVTSQATGSTAISPNNTIATPQEDLSETNIYTETAQVGDGITHLARKALGKYLDEHGQNASVLTPAHKLFIEDYMQKATGNGWLQLGQKVTFSKVLIEKAIEASLQLTNAQLKNLNLILSVGLGVE